MVWIIKRVLVMLMSRVLLVLSELIRWVEMLVLVLVLVVIKIKLIMVSCSIEKYFMRVCRVVIV